MKGFAFPLGIDPGGIDAPTQGYTIAYTAGQDDEPDSYVFQVVVSHEKLRPILQKAFELLPDRVYGIVEVGSRDAYRSVDVYMGEEAVGRQQFVKTWREYEPLLLEDGSIAAGANSDEPFIELFLDHWKGLHLHVPLDMREEVERLLHSFGLEEVVQTWAEPEDASVEDSTQLRPVLADGEEMSDIDELLMELRRDWRLELNVDPETNVDEGGRELGQTLWHAIVVVDHAEKGAEGRADLSIWATAGSLNEMEGMIDKLLEEQEEWRFVEVFTVDRVAFDERPEELADLTPKRREAQVHLVTIEPWMTRPQGGGDG